LKFAGWWWRKGRPRWTRDWWWGKRGLVVGEGEG